MYFLQNENRLQEVLRGTPLLGEIVKLAINPKKRFHENTLKLIFNVWNNDCALVYSDFPGIDLYEGVIRSLERTKEYITSTYSSRVKLVHRQDVFGAIDKAIEDYGEQSSFQWGETLVLLKDEPEVNEVVMFLGYHGNKREALIDKLGSDSHVEIDRLERMTTNNFKYAHIYALNDGDTVWFKPTNEKPLMEVRFEHINDNHMAVITVTVMDESEEVVVSVDQLETRSNFVDE